MKTTFRTSALNYKTINQIITFKKKRWNQFSSIKKKVLIKRFLISQAVFKTLSFKAVFFFIEHKLMRIRSRTHLNRRLDFSCSFYSAVMNFFSSSMTQEKIIQFLGFLFWNFRFKLGNEIIVFMSKILKRFF